MWLTLAIITVRGEAVISFSLAMAVVTVYYVLFVWASTVGTQGLLPPGIALWMPNILVAVASFFLFKKIAAT